VTISISQALATARAEAVRAFLDNGTDHASVDVLDAAGALLVNITLAKPCGTAAVGVLTIARASGTVSTSGTAAAARVRSAAGAVAIEGLTVTESGAGGDIEAGSVALYAGGEFVLTELVIS
jgi:hypothetical protein